MANNDTSVTVRGQWVDNISAPAKQSAQNVKQATSSMSSGMSRTGIVSDKTGKAMTRFNEKTERVRQVMMMTGSTMGGVAGQASYMAGSLGAVVGGMKKTEMAAAGMIVVLAGVAYGVKKAYDELNDSTRAAAKHMNDMQAETVKLRKEVSKYRDELYMLETGMTDWEFQIENNKVGIENLTSAVTRMRLEYLNLLEDTLAKYNFDEIFDPNASDWEKAKGLMGGVVAMTSDLGDATKRYHKLQNLSESLKARKDEIIQLKQQNEAIQAQTDKKKELDELEKKIETRKKASRKEELEGSAIVGAVGGYFEEFKADVEYANKKVELQQETDRVIAKQKRLNAEENFRLEEQYRQEDLQATRQVNRMKMAEENKAKEQMLAISEMAISGTMNGLSALIGASAKQVQETLKSMAIEAGARALFELAMGWATAAIYNYDAASKHFVAAGMFGSFAALYGAGSAIAGTQVKAESEDDSQGGAANRAASTQTQERQQSAFVINVYGNQVFGQDGDRDLLRRVESARRNDNPGNALSSFQEV